MRLLRFLMGLRRSPSDVVPKPMPLYWLCYRHNNHISVVIEPGASPIHARMRAGLVNAHCAGRSRSFLIAFTASSPGGNSAGRIARRVRPGVRGARF
jgi:hypothetical protein